MGTTLTGTTPQDTYDSLIKVTDNGPISGTLKALSDGLGNDSTLSLSTTAASIAGTLAVSGNATFDTNTLFVDAANNRVGVGTVTTTQALTVNGNAAVGGQQAFWLRDDDGFTANAARRAWAVTANSAIIGTFSIYGATAANSNPLSGTPFLNITSAGNAGIGTTEPANKLVVKAAGYGAIASFLDTADNGFVFKADAFNGFNAIDQTQQMIMNFSGSEKYRFNTDGVLAVGSGIQFPATQVASANANTLDDYEEGTFTPTAFGATTAGTTTYNGQNGYYTKIGRQVTASLYVSYSSMTGTGTLKIGGLPFAIGNLTENYPVGSCIASAVNWTGGTYLQANGVLNESNLYVVYVSDDASANVQDCVDESANYRITITYFTA